MKLVLKVLNWIKNNISKFFIWLGGIGLFAGIAGIFEGHEANKKNKKAEEIRNEALKIHDESRSSTQEELDLLGNLEIEIIESFDHFVSAMGKIQVQSSGLVEKIIDKQLPDYAPEELKALSNNVRMAIDGLGGAAMGAGAGLAAFGVSIFALGPAAFAGGVVLCAKGIGLSKKATQNVKKAKQLRKEVDEIVDYYGRLKKASLELRESIEMMKIQYYTHLKELERIVSEKTVWRQFSKAEKKIVKNTILLVQLLQEMCITPLSVHSEDANKIESINEKELRKVENKAKNILKSVA